MPLGSRERFENVTETTSVSPFQDELVLVLKERHNFNKESTHGLKFTFFCMYIQILFIHLIKFFPRCLGILHNAHLSDLEMAER